MKKICHLWVVLLLFSCVSKHRIIDTPILFNAEREALTLNYMSSHYGLVQQEPTIEPKMIVLHWTVIPTFKESFETFYPATLPDRPDIKAASALNVSSQFMVDRDGAIHQLLSETIMARHVIGLNHCAIGIENVGGTENLPLTKKQLAANIWLVNYLAEKYNIDYLIGHYEYTNFEGHELWLEKDESYRTLKTDPGADFMKKVRMATLKNNFKPLPVKK